MLSGKTALVTGSTSGIGLAMARSLAGEGANIMLNGFGDPAAIEEIRTELAQTHGVTVGYNGADMSRPDDIANLIGSTETEVGPIDILINNAGIQHTARIEEFPPEKWDAILAINLSSAFHTIRLAVPGMRERGWGRIINTASVHGLVASVDKAAYVAAKHGIIGLTKVVGLENAGTGVTCNAICPGWVRTPLIEQQIEALAKKNSMTIEEGAKLLLGVKQPSEQFVMPEQLGASVLYLCSSAAEQMTGTQLTIDGGWTAR
jgi:3-hydroxybutyrate dehydrogenase